MHRGTRSSRRKLAVVVAALLFLITTFAGVTDSSQAAPPASRPAAKTGSSSPRSRLTFTQRNPLSAPEAVLPRLDRAVPLRKPQPDDPSRAMARWVYQLSKEPFEVIVPAEYSKSVPHGLIVWLGDGEVPEAWHAALARQKLILISPANRFSERVTIVRVGLALDAVHNAEKKFTLDSDRIYLAGYSSGAQLGAWMIRAYPDVFRGSILMMGGWFNRVHQGAHAFSPDRSTVENAWYPGPATMQPRWKLPLEDVKRDTKIVLVRGEMDNAFGSTIEQERVQYEGLRLDGFVRAQYFEIPQWGHQLPDENWFEKSLLALDAPPAKAPTTAPSTSTTPSDDAIAQAKRLLTAAQHGDFSKMDALAQRIVDDYPNTPAAAEARDFLAKGGVKHLLQR